MDIRPQIPRSLQECCKRSMRTICQIFVRKLQKNWLIDRRFCCQIFSGGPFHRCRQVNITTWQILREFFPANFNKALNEQIVRHRNIRLTVLKYLKDKIYDIWFQAAAKEYPRSNACHVRTRVQHSVDAFFFLLVCPTVRRALRKHGTTSTVA